ncbi:fibrinogen-like protein A [Ruditapes philippinarum]|uniref:fibrinogen-like protein A n=1 Tax=Ruditapes philippinarum TaxID=129788 RepID=UPI00295C2781|nr:fibrinogen-like protein A [Ruditapes philippinarum]
MSKKKDINANGVIISFVWIFMNALSIILADDISWTKYEFEAKSVQPRCFPEEGQCLAYEVPDVFACSKMCNKNGNCTSFFYQPENRTCTGCPVFVKGAPMSTTTGSVQYAIRDFYIDCLDILQRDITAESGVYEIRLRNSERKQVYCDMSTDGGGWTIFQNRFDESVDFRKHYSLYTTGFGDVNGEYWLGLKYIQELSENPTELWYNVSLTIGETAHEKYGHFRLIGTDYILSVDHQLEKSGMASDAEIVFGSLNGHRFSVTEYSYSSTCGTTGWWSEYPKCQFVNLNIETFLHVSDLYNDVAELKGHTVVKTTRIMIRRKV